MISANFYNLTNGGEWTSFKSNASTFSPTVTKLTAGSPIWLLSNNYRTNTDNPNYTDGTGTYDVRLSADRLRNINTVNMVSQGLIGGVDLNKFDNLGGAFRADGNPQLTALTLPNSSQVFTQFYLFNCDLRDVDCNGLSGLGGVFSMRGNPNLTALTLPNSSEVFTGFYLSYHGFDSTDITGELILTGLSNLGGIFQIQGNSNLTALTLPNSSGIFTKFYAYSCNIPYIDYWPISAGTNNGISMRQESNTMTTINVNHTLVDLDDIGWTGGTINIAGDNSAPDGSSGGYDGTTAKTNLLAKDWTVTTT